MEDGLPLILILGWELGLVSPQSMSADDTYAGGKVNLLPTVLTDGVSHIAS